jgi:lysophospholipase L1-like esterase
MEKKKNRVNPGLVTRITHLKSLPYKALFYCLIFFLGSCAQKEVKVFCIGDSTMSHYDLKGMEERYGGPDFPRRGWAMALSAYLNDNAEVRNLAVSGRSSKNFRTQGYWDKVLEEIQEGDFVVIQFGHNDEKVEDTTRYTEAFGAFKDNLIRYAKEAEEHGAFPVIASSIARRKFNAEEQLVDTHGDYVLASREAAKEAGVPLIDLNQMTTDYLNQLGPEKSKEWFLHIKPGIFEKLPEGMEDNTHLSKQGACAVSGLFAEGLEQSKSPLKNYLLDNKPDCNNIL